MKAASQKVSGTHLWLVLMKAHHALERVAIRSIESLGVGLSDFAVMEMLLHKGPLPVNEIGRRIALTSGAITTAVDRLESRKLVARETHASDRRARIVRLTATGKAQAKRLFACHQTAMDAAASGLSAPERALLARLLKQLGNVVTTQPQESLHARPHSRNVRPQDRLSHPRPHPRTDHPSRQPLRSR